MGLNSAERQKLDRLVLVELQKLAPAVCERYWWSEGRRMGDVGYRFKQHDFADDFADRPRDPEPNRAFWRGVLEGCVHFKFTGKRKGKMRGNPLIYIHGLPEFRWYLVDSMYQDFPNWDRQKNRENSVITTCITDSTIVPSGLVRTLVNLLWPTGHEFIAKESFRDSIESVRAFSPRNAEQRRLERARLLGIPMAMVNATLNPDLGPRPDYSCYRPNLENLCGHSGTVTNDIE